MTGPRVKQNEFTKQAIKESLLSPAKDDKILQQDQGRELNNNESISKGNELNTEEEQQIQNNHRQNTQEDRFKEK